MNTKLKPRSLPFFALLLSALFWGIDAVIDVLIFKENDSVLENFISPEPVELWMRSLVVVLFIVFSFYARYLLTLQIRASDKLLKYKDELEDMIRLRTKELESKNKELEDEIVMRKKIEETLEKIVELKND